MLILKKKLTLSSIVLLGLCLISFVYFPMTSNAATAEKASEISPRIKVERVDDYYYRVWFKSNGLYSAPTGHTYKELRFVNGYTKSGPVESLSSSNVATKTYKYTYKYYTY